MLSALHLLTTVCIDELCFTIGEDPELPGKANTSPCEAATVAGACALLYVPHVSTPEDQATMFRGHGRETKSLASETQLGACSFRQSQANTSQLEPSVSQQADGQRTNKSRPSNAACYVHGNDDLRPPCRFPNRARWGRDDVWRGNKSGGGAGER